MNWVQCDRCEEWFHLLCVGLGDDEITEDEEYECFRCKQGVQSLFSDHSVSYNDKLSATESFVKQIRLSTPEKTLSPSTGVEVQTENFSTDDSLEMPSAMANQQTLDSPAATPVDTTSDNHGRECDNSDVTMETQTKDTDSEPESEKEEDDDDEEVEEKGEEEEEVEEKEEEEVEEKGEEEEDEEEERDEAVERIEGLNEAMDSDHDLEPPAENLSKSPVGVAS